MLFIFLSHNVLLFKSTSNFSYFFQEKWSQGMTAAAGVVLLGGERTVKAFENMEHAGVPLSAGFVRSCFEKMVVVDDVNYVLSKMEAAGSRASGKQLKQLCDETVNRRFATWCVMHEDLDDSVIHPTRSM